MRATLNTTVILICMAGATGALRAQSVAEPEMMIRLYDSVGILESDLHAAQQVAGAILNAAGAPTRWRECWRDGGVSRPEWRVCDDPRRPTELIVRIVGDRSEPRTGPMALGYSLVAANSGSATLATVFGDRVTHLAGRTRVDSAIVLGRAMAHEVGHLLLDSGDHSADGLMRAHWSDRALREADTRWLFSIDQSRRIRAAVLARSGPSADLLAVSIARREEPDDPGVLRTGSAGN